MKKTRNHNDWIIGAAGVGLALICFVLGTRASAWPGGGMPAPCPQPPCECKVVTFWQPPGMPMYGAFAPSSKTDTKPTAMLNINTGTGGCQHNPLKDNGKFDRWNIPWGGPNCTPPPNNLFLTELAVTQAQQGTVPGTLLDNQIANNCSP